MVRKNTVFIHTNEPQLFGGKIAAYSFQKASRNPEKFDVRIITVEEFSHLNKRQGQNYIRKGREAYWNNRDLQSFTPLRFSPPQLMNYEGRAVVVDPDVFALADINELFTLDMQNKPIVCRQTQSAFGKDPYWGTSVMLLDCENLTHWKWDQMIDDMFEKKFDYGNWISLRMEDQQKVGKLDPAWNDFDHLDKQTKMLHTTERSTQPWKTGLPIDFDTIYNKPAKPTFGQKLLKPLQQILGIKVTPQVDVPRYAPHPDPNQERLFFSLLTGALEEGIVTEADIRYEMSKDFMRHDAVEVLRKIPPFNWNDLPDGKDVPRPEVSASLLAIRAASGKA